MLLMLLQFLSQLQLSLSTFNLLPTGPEVMFFFPAYVRFRGKIDWAFSRTFRLEKSRVFYMHNILTSDFSEISRIQVLSTRWLYAKSFRESSDACARQRALRTLVHFFFSLLSLIITRFARGKLFEQIFRYI